MALPPGDMDGYKNFANKINGRQQYHIRETRRACCRFEEVSTLITDPAVIADQKRYVKLTKEYKELGDLMEAVKNISRC